MTALSPWRIAADTGGTFTDCHALAPDGAEHRVKVLSSGCLRTEILEIQESGSLLVAGHWDQKANFFAGYTLRSLALPTAEARVASSLPEGDHTILSLEASLPDVGVGQLVELTCGEMAPVLGTRLLTGTKLGKGFPPILFRLATTRATNALLEQKGVKTAVFITQGFQDLLQIGDQRRKHLFALQHHPRPVLEAGVFGVQERLDAKGAVMQPVEEESLRAAARKFVAGGITTAAVTLMHSDLNPEHERQVVKVLLEEGFQHVSLSSELAPFVKILPRAQSTLANAYLTGPVDSFIQGVRAPLGEASLHLMTSAASLEPAALVHPKDLLLSGPSAGVLGALHAARELGHERIITFDMGGTSTDVARLDGAVSYRFHQQVGGVTLLSPAVALETVAAGGGSICAWTPSGLAVGPHSAASDPGPACYGKGGPLTITDVNLLLGRFDASLAPIPLNEAAAEAQLQTLLVEVNAASVRQMGRKELLQALLALATEHMADAIRKISVLEGYDPAEYALLAFGGAGPQHACDVAESLGIKTILVPHHAGILSAVGLQGAQPERFAEEQVLRLLAEVQEELPSRIETISQQATASLAEISGALWEIPNLRFLAELRLVGQDTPLQLEFSDPQDLRSLFISRYKHLFGYLPPESKPVELVSIRVVARAGRPPAPRAGQRDTLPPVEGPTLVQDAFSTLVVAEGWQAQDVLGVGWTLRWVGDRKEAGESVQLPDLLRHRLQGVVEEMGALLRRTALSTNIRERLDFSCALLSPEGKLVTSAPHIPVHLGALGVCVRQVMEIVNLGPGDTVITNHPAMGGSHLPDVTLITPVYDANRELLGFIANRAHHAEIGGRSPGSMPADASTLEEEGVILPPAHLVRGEVADFETLRARLLDAPFPTRAVEDNMADVHAQLAANRLGAERLLSLACTAPQIRQILLESQTAMRRFMENIPEGEAMEHLDDGALIAVSIRRQEGGLVIDFTGTSGQHPKNLNATPAIVRSAVLYVLRLALQEDLPLNEGLLEDVEIILPAGSLLNPDFSGSLLPAVVGGNVEISQRVVDTLLKVWGMQSCSQGTMNNFLFGNARFGYYETICGGTGAGKGYAGASAQHSHMTNTAITDPEILERRFPVRLREFSIRRGSGGAGRWSGGDGVVREFEFLEPLTVSLLTQHRSVAPYGLMGGNAGVCGKQILLRADGSAETLPSAVTFDALPAERLRIETPGGGGYGQL